MCRHVQKTNTVREATMVLGFSWLAEKVMNKRKEQGIRLIVVKVEIVNMPTNFPDLVDMRRFSGAYFVAVCSTKSTNLV